MLDNNIIIIFGAIIGLWMAWGVGANDLANIMSTTMGSKAISLRLAVLIAIIFEIAGALLGGNHVTDTIRNGIINTHALSTHINILVYAMLSVLLAGATWMTVASFVGMPVSITNAIIGSLVGLGAITLGVSSIHWHKVTLIAISWVSSPVIAGIMAFLLFISIKRLILGRQNPYQATQKYISYYLLLVGLVLGYMTTLKTLQHFGVPLNIFYGTLVVSITAIVVMIIGILFIKRIIKKTVNINRHSQFQHIEQMFAVLMAFTACAMVFAHGSNDVAIAVGPFAAILSIVLKGHTAHNGLLQYGVFLFGSLGVLLGFVMYGRKVIETVGSGITALTPSRAFSATLAAASAVVFSTSLGIPVSATQTLVGAVLGVGMARGIGALNLNVIRNIIMSWIITIPAAATLAIIYFSLLKNFHVM